ncbi:MAG: hypothetical protein FJ225_09160 [Lentisphaerae bacterium]|nr:hypothetical protein [Planctomycetota bacterium]MBM4143740.1 hypothetical protein [Lentisphaerota bacterium]
MATAFPFLSRYDPPGTSEGTLDPMGLYQIADQLAVQLVPAVRERMQRIRFLTAMAVGAAVTEGMEDDPEQRDASPYLVWEWLVVEARVRAARAGDHTVWGVPGSDVTHRAIEQHGYLDARSYLKTPRIFGFNGVYKRLALHLGLVDVHLGPGLHAERLVDAWARSRGLGGVEGAKATLAKWADAVRRSLRERPPRTKPGWGNAEWAELAEAFAPGECKGQERRFLRESLCASVDRRLGAFPDIWALQAGFANGDYREEILHHRLEQAVPAYGTLLKAIRAYEAFARSLQDSFDVLKAVATGADSGGFAVPAIASDADFAKSVECLHERFEAAYRALSEVTLVSVSLPNLFTGRFQAFAEPMAAADCALAVCRHHEEVQKAKSAEGKRAWFDRIGGDRIYIRHAYREKRRDIALGRYVHDYRGQPIRRFYRDLT